MYAKSLIVFALVGYAYAGVIDLGHHGAATSYSSISTHLGAPVAVVKAPVAHIAHVGHVAPVVHASPYAHVTHVAPVAHVAHVAHVAPVAHVAHVAPVAHVAHVAPLVKAIHQEVYPDAHPHYTFEYGVQDGHTGDIKNQHEERDGDIVKGVYSLVQPDGTTRTVHYTADDHSGFNAQVEVTGNAHPQVVAKTIVPAKTIVAAPVYHAYHH